MDVRLAIPVSKKLSYEEAATVGVGIEVCCCFFTLLLTKQNVKRVGRSCKGPSSNSLCAGEKTASLGLFNGLRIPLPDPKALPEAKDEWILILGGAGSVGQYAIQVRKNMYSYRWTKKKTLKSQLIFLACQTLWIQGCSNILWKIVGCKFGPSPVFIYKNFSSPRTKTMPSILTKNEWMNPKAYQRSRRGRIYQLLEDRRRAAWRFEKNHWRQFLPNLRYSWQVRQSFPSSTKRDLHSRQTR